MRTPELRAAQEPRVIICGAGSLGGNLVEHLARLALPAKLTVIDHDRVEAINVGNQPYDLRQTGVSKVYALAERIYEACGCEVEGIHAMIDEKTSIRLLKGADLVVDTLDNAAGRRAVRDACAALGIAALHAGLGTDGYFDVRTNDSYRIEQPQDGGQPCRNLTTRGQVLLAVALAAEAIRRALAGERIGNRADSSHAFWERTSVP